MGDKVHIVMVLRRQVPILLKVNYGKLQMNAKNLKATTNKTKAVASNGTMGDKMQ